MNRLQFSSLHAGTSGATSHVDFEGRGSIVWRAADFGGLVLESWLDGVQVFHACGRVAGSSAVVCRAVGPKADAVLFGPRNYRPLVIGVPPQ